MNLFLLLIQVKLYKLYKSIRLFLVSQKLSGEWKIYTSTSLYPRV